MIDPDGELEQRADGEPQRRLLLEERANSRENVGYKANSVGRRRFLLPLAAVRLLQLVHELHQWLPCVSDEYIDNRVA